MSWDSRYINQIRVLRQPMITLDKTEATLWDGLRLSSSVGSLVVLFGFVDDITEAACELVADQGFEQITKFATVGVEEELTTTAASSIPPMATANNAVFYGIENDDNETLAPRILGSILNNPNDQPLYGADNLDEVGLAFVSSAISFYTMKMNGYQAVHDFFCDDATFDLCWTSAENIAEGYRKGLEWLEDFNSEWKWVIGAERADLIQMGCECTDIYGQTAVLGNTDCDDVYTGYPFQTCSDLYTYQTNEYPSDAFILAESAMAAPGMNYDAQLMEGSNHLQMRNDSKMEQAITKIFDLGIEEGRGFFNTEER